LLDTDTLSDGSLPKPGDLALIARSRGGTRIETTLAVSFFLSPPSIPGMITLGAVIGLAAFVTAWAAQKVDSAVEDPAAASVYELLRLPERVDGTAILGSALWGEPESVEPPRDDATVAACGADLRLVGTVVSDSPEVPSMALLAGIDGPVGPLTVGAELGEHRIDAITAHRVELVREDARCDIRLFAAPEAEVARLEPDTAGEAVEGIEDRGGGAYGVPRTLLRSALTGGGGTRARLIPGPRGVRVYGLRRADPVHQLGLRNGDTILEVSGRSVRDLDALMQLVSELETLSAVTVRAERVGVVRDLRYAITD